MPIQVQDGREDEGNGSTRHHQRRDMNAGGEPHASGRDLETLVRQRIDDWRRRLIDLSFRNRLINYRPTKQSTLTLIAPNLRVLADATREAPFDFYLPPESAEDDDRAAHARVIATVVPGSDEIVADLDSRKRIERVLDNLARRSNAEFEDKALRILHLAAGFLEWEDVARKERLVSPLILVPVELKRESPRHPYRLFFARDEETVINPALTIKLETDAGLTLSEDWAWEDKAVDLELEEIRRALGSTGWTVNENIALGLFSFQKMVMYRDLLRNEDRIAAHATVRSLATGVAEPTWQNDFDRVPGLEQLDEAQKPQDCFSVLDADASQRRSIEAAKRGCSFVMHGPPGTGKSQTIANIIAEGLGQQKRILFISEKIAALDVVHKRLAERGLAEFCLKLHGRDAGRREVVESLYESLSTKMTPRPVMSDADFDRLAATRRRLSTAVEQLHRKSPVLLGLAPREVYGKLASLHRAPYAGGAPPATERSGTAASSELDSLLGSFRTVEEHWRVATDNNFAWRGFHRTRYDDAERSRLLTLLADARSAEAGLRDSAEGVAISLGLPVPSSPTSVRDLCHLGTIAEQTPAIPAQWLNRELVPELRDTAVDAQHAHQLYQELESTFSEGFPDRELSDLPSNIDEQLDQAIGELEELAGRNSSWEDRLVDQLPAIVRFLSEADQRIDAITNHGRRVAEMLGQPWEQPKPDDLGRVCDLADLAFRLHDRPDPRWLVQAGLQQAQVEYERCQAIFVGYQKSVEALMDRYTEAVLELDVDVLGARFTASEGRRFAKLNSQYRSDCKVLRGTRRDGRVPPTVVDELREIRRAVSVGGQIDVEHERYSAVFGAWHKGRSNDMAALGRALQAANDVLALAAPNSDLELLSQRVCVGAQGDTELAQAATVARETLAGFQEGLRQVCGLCDDGLARQLTEGTLEEVRSALRRLREPMQRVADVVSTLRSGRKSSSGRLSEIRHDAELISVAHAQVARIDQRRGAWIELLGVVYRGPDTVWAELESSVAWLAEFFDALAGDLPRELRDKLTAETTTWPDFESLAQAANDYEAAIERIAADFESGRAAEIRATASAQSSQEIVCLIDALASSVDQLHQWTDFQAARQHIESAAWGSFLATLRARTVPSAEVVSAFELSWWHRRLDRLYEEQPELGEFRGRSHERLIDAFRELDRQHLAAAVDRIIAVCNADRPTPVAVEGSEVGILKREHGKKRRHMPVRVLLSRLPTLLPGLKPCLMMSPLAVSHYLSPDHHFDMVIFDEASQVPPWDAINCIYRGAQLIIAGDSKQLPPTPFFKLADPEGDSYDDEGDLGEEVMESILDASEAILPSETLRWHYRSRHEHLIAFSNHHIYNNKLVTFPAPVLESAELGVHLVHVPDGVYDRGRSSANRIEARRVAERVIEHVEDRPDRSLGVVAFSVAQADAIIDELDLLRAGHPELEQYFAGDRLQNIFVKNLESVQGDERDVMIFSVGYGYDVHHKFYQAFGPLNRDGGHRRLNVAVTRAREQVDVVTSVLARDFDLAESAAPGARLLREYLEFAEKGPEALRTEIESMGGDYESPFEESVADAVRGLGYQPIPQVGVGGFRIDLGVVDPTARGRFALGIECDGATYHSTPTARDRDRLRQQVLEDLGWRIHRIWSWDWVRDRGNQIARLKGCIEASINGTGSRKTAQPSHPVSQPEDITRKRETLTVHEIDSSLSAKDLPWVEEYARCGLYSPGVRYEFHEPANLYYLEAVLQRLVEGEAPVEIGYAIKRLAEAQGITRRGNRVTDAGNKAIRRVEARGGVEVRGQFLWRPGQQIAVVRVPDPDDHRTRRGIQEIPPEEIDLAFARLREAAGIVDEEQLVTQTARLFGFDRTGTRIQTVLGERLANQP